MSGILSERNRAAATMSRRDWISELSRADGEFLTSLWATAEQSPDFTFLRPPEIGAVMTRGRAGGVGAPFNLAEATATRCSVRLAGGAEGHAYALGRDKRKAEISALCDALMQTDAATVVRDAVLEPLLAARLDRERTAARKAAATKVEFFTMTRGEND